MIQTMLVPTDFTIESEELLSCVGELKNAGLKEVILLHVVDIFKAQGLAPKFEENAKKMIEEYRGLLVEMGIDTKALVIQGDVKKTIVQVADKEDVDCIVMGATTSGLIRGHLTGRTTEYISSRSGKIVLIEKYDTLKKSEKGSYTKACYAKFSKVMIPVDFSDNSKKILEEMVHLTDIIDEIVLVHIIEDAKNKKELDDKISAKKKMLHEMGAGIEGISKIEYVVTEGKVSEELDRLAEEMEITLIAITTHGIGSVKDILMGSNAEELLRRTVKPILLIPAGKR